MPRKMLWCAAFSMVLALGAFTPQKARASGVPVFDASALAQWTQQILEMAKQLAEMEKQTGRLDDIISDLRGPRGMSDLLNGAAQEAARRYSDTDLSGFIDLAAGSGTLSSNAGDPEAAAKDILASYGLRPGAAVIPNEPDGVRARSIDLAQGTTIAAMTVGESAFNASGDRLASIEGLIAAIDNTADLKASVDLNTRVQGEVAVLLNEMLTVQALQLRSTSVSIGLGAVADEQVVSTFGFDRATYNALGSKPLTLPTAVGE